MTLCVIDHVRCKKIVQEYYIQVLPFPELFDSDRKVYLWGCRRNQTLPGITAFFSKGNYEAEKSICIKTNKNINGQWTWRGRKSFGISADRNDWPGWLKDFFGFEIFQFQDFFGLVNLATIFWGGLIFLGIENNLKIRGIFPPIRSSLSLDRFPPPYPEATENLWNRDLFNFF